MQMSTGERLVFNTKQAAAFLGMSPRTLEGMRMRGTGPRYVKLGPGRGALVGYRPEDLTAWLEENIRSSTSHKAA
jgi:predicted DNA-binding transcriptional regulator AlpA